MSDEVGHDRRIAALAARQHAMVSIGQLRGLGLTDDQIAYRVRCGRLTPYWRGVYSVGPLLQPFSPVMAALLACPGAVASHWTAAWLHKLIAKPLADVHIIVPTQRRSRPGLVIHRAKLAPHEIWDGQSLSLTSPFRTLSDLRRTPVFEKAVWEASYQRLITDAEAKQLLGYKPPTADHEGERVLEDLIRQAGLPAPKTNVRIGRFEIDLYWPEQRLAVELDGEDGHGHELGKARDARKDADLERRGIALVRVGGEELSEKPLAALATIAAALAPAA
jgi:very-short-patch-repair endonuclease